MARLFRHISHEYLLHLVIADRLNDLKWCRKLLIGDTGDTTSTSEVRGTHRCAEVRHSHHGGGVLGSHHSNSLERMLLLETIL